VLDENAFKAGGAQNAAYFGGSAAANYVAARSTAITAKSRYFAVARVGTDGESAPQPAACHSCQPAACHSLLGSMFDDSSRLQLAAAGLSAEHHIECLGHPYNQPTKPRLHSIALQAFVSDVDMLHKPLQMHVWLYAAVL
jgi:hypothetical protein